MKKYTLKKFFSIALSVSALAVSLVSCEKDEPIETPAPVVRLTEVGSGNSKQAYIGGDLHIDGQLSAEGLIEKVDIEIHQEGGSFEISTSLTEGTYIGARSAQLHEHIDIPANAPAGDYHLHVTVTDKNGRTITAESALKLIEKPVFAALTFQALTSTDPEFKHGDHFHGTGSAAPVGDPIRVTFDEDGHAISGGHLHLDADAVYRVELKTYDVQGNETQGTRFTAEANHKVFVTGTTYKLNKDEGEDGAIFTANNTGTTLHFTIGEKNEGPTQQITMVWRKLNAGVTSVRNDWNKADFATLFPGTNELELMLEIHAEHGHAH